MKHKKGNAIMDGLVILIVLFGFAIISIVGARILNETNTDIQADLNLQEAKDISANLNTNYSNLFDNLILFAFVMLIVFVIVSVFMIDTHPIFFIITILLLMAVFIVAAILGNAFDDVMQDASFSSYANNFPYTSWIFGHIVELMIATGFIIAITMFIKFKR